MRALYLNIFDLGLCRACQHHKTGKAEGYELIKEEDNRRGKAEGRNQIKDRRGLVKVLSAFLKFGSTFGEKRAHKNLA